MPFGIRRFNITSKRGALCAFSFPFPRIRFTWCSTCSFTFRFPAVGYSMGHTFDCTVTLFGPSALPTALPTMASADFSQFVVTTAFAPPARPHGISRQSFLVYLPDLRTWVTVAFWTSLPFASLSAMLALYQVSVRQVLFRYPFFSPVPHGTNLGSRYKGSSATTPLVDFHHRLTACPSYKKYPPLLTGITEKSRGIYF